jgi:hypothetical protein
MTPLDLTQFPHVWVVDAEFAQPAGERPEVHCVVAAELWSGRTLRLGHEQLARLRTAPYPIGPGSLFTCYNGLAELTCHLALGWPLPDRILDLLVEFRWLTNGSGWREGEKSKHRLIDAAEYFGLDPMGAAEKSEMQALAIRGKPFTPEESRDLLVYCETDVVVTTKLLRRMAPCLTLQALQRGRFVRTAARMLHAGVPLDVATLRRVQERREGIIQALVEEVNPSFGVFQGLTFKMERMESLVRQHGLCWPRLNSGCLGMDKDVWKRMAERYPFLEPLHQARRTTSLLRDNDLAVGRDARNRYGFFPFAADTGRNAWKAGQFIFAQPAYLRGLVQPPPGKVLAYLDYGAQEFAVAAVLAGDERMAEAYQADDPYLTFGKQAALIPASATKESHGTERKNLKACVLGLQFLISKWGLADRLGIQTDYAEVLIAAHRRVYRHFWAWVDAVVDRALLDGFQETLLGWRTAVRDGEAMRRGRPARRFNPRAAVNFPVQGGAADVTRLACNLVSERGITVLANIHDALLIEGDVDVIDDLADETGSLMVQAGRELLQGFTLKVDRRVVRYPDRLVGDDDRERWAWLLGHLDELEAGKMLHTSNIDRMCQRSARCCTPATSDVARQQHG